MRFKLFLLLTGVLFLSACSSSWFGEDPPKIPDLKIHYMKNDSETIQCFKIIDIQHEKFLNGRLNPDGFVKMIDCSEMLLLKGASHIELKTKDVFTAGEVETILNSGVLGESANVEKWVKRLVALARVLYGSETEAIMMADILELFRRIRQAAPYVSKLSVLMYAQNGVFLEGSPEFWELRKKIFAALFEIARNIIKNKQGEVEFPLVKEIFLHQRENFDLGIRQEIWDRFVEIFFVINKTILGHSEDVVRSPEDILSILNILDFAFQKIFDVYGIYAAKSWTPREWVSIIKRYEELLAKFLDAFSESKAQEIQAQDLARILNLVHGGTQEYAHIFVDALVDLKANIFKSSGSAFSRQDVKELRQFLHEAIEEAREVNVHSSVPALDMSKITHLWKSPFMALSSKKYSSTAEEEELSTLLLHFIDHIIRIHDDDQDGKLSVNPKVASASGERVYKELSSLIHTVQKMVLGFRKLMGESSLLNSVEQVGADTIGKMVIAVSDKLLVNSDQDGNLSRYEILELMSFAAETDRLVSDLLQEGSIAPQGVKGLYRNSILREHFPKLFQVFLNFEDFKGYMQFYLALLNKEDIRTMTAGELRVIFGLMRLVEYVFLKFDTNQDHILVKSEIVAAYSVFNSLVAEIVAYLNTSGKKAEFLDVRWLRTWWEIGTEAKVIEAVVVYAFTEGKIPSRLSQVIAGSSKSYATRMDILKLFSESFSYLK